MEPDQLKEARLSAVRVMIPSKKSDRQDPTQGDAEIEVAQGHLASKNRTSVGPGTTARIINGIRRYKIIELID